MDVLVPLIEVDPPFGYVVADLGEGLLQPIGLVGGQQAGVLQRPHVGDAGLDVLRSQPDVEVQGPAEGVRLGRRRFAEPTRPEPVLAASGSFVTVTHRGHSWVRPCLAAHTFKGSPYRRTYPSACDWSNASSDP